MIRPLGFGLAVLGIGLLIWGLQRANSFSSQVAEVFTGSPDNQAMWLIIGGVAVLVCGGAMVLMGGRAADR